MGYPLKIDGRLIEFPSKADAEAFLLNKVLVVPQAQPIRVGGRISTEPRQSNVTMVRGFLNAIHGGGERGVNTGKIMRAVGIESPRAFGNRGKNINRLLKGLGFEPHDVYTNARNDKGDREWKQGPKFAQAMEAVAKAGGGS